MCVFINAHKAPSNPSALKHRHICLESLTQQAKGNVSVLFTFYYH